MFVKHENCLWDSIWKTVVLFSIHSLYRKQRKEESAAMHTKTLHAHKPNESIGETNSKEWSEDEKLD